MNQYHSCSCIDLLTEFLLMFSPDLKTLGSTRNQTQGQYVGMHYQCQYFITDTAKDWGLLVRKQNSRDRTEIVSDENVGAQNIATVQQN